MGFDTILSLVAIVLGSRYFSYWHNKHRPMWPLARCISRDALQTLRLFSLVFLNPHGVFSTCVHFLLHSTHPCPLRDKVSLPVGLPPLSKGPSRAYRSYS